MLISSSRRFLPFRQVRIGQRLTAEHKNIGLAGGYYLLHQLWFRMRAHRGDKRFNMLLDSGRVLKVAAVFSEHARVRFN